MGMGLEGMFQVGSQFDWGQAFLCEDVPRHGYSGQLLYPLPPRPLLFRPPNSGATFEKLNTIGQS